MLTFLGIGAQKAGTTWLYAQLKKHPRIGFPLGKEAHFWNRLNDPRQIETYLAGFDDPDLSQGEITPAYALLPVVTIARIHQVAPRLRLIYLLRNPIERAWSAALMALARAEMTLDEASDAWFVDHFRSSGSLRRGDYASCIRNWRQVFPADQLLLERYEAIRAEPEALLRRCCAHIGVAPPEPALLAGCRERVFVGPGHALRPTLRQVLIEIYRPLLRELERELGEDFGDWLQAPPAVA
jgi:hypothetical protein